MNIINTIKTKNVLFLIEIFPPLSSHYENFIVRNDYTKI